MRLWRGKKEYRVSNFEDDNVSPEETLPDSLGGQSKIEVPIPESVVFVFYILIGAVFLFFLFSSFNLEILQGRYFRSIAAGNRSTFYQVPSMRGVILDNAGQILADNQPVFDLVGISSDLPDKKEEINAMIQELSLILKEPAENLSNVFNEGKLQSLFFIKKDLKKDEVLQIQNRYQRGVYIANGVKRLYSDSVKFSSIIGYTGKVGPEDLKDSYYNPNDRKGRTGIEESYEDFLRGKHGRIFFDKAGKNYVFDDATAGNEVVLNINGEIQKHLYDSLDNILRSSGLKSGSAVAQNPNTGEILGMVSFPSFDNNQLTSDLSQDLYKKYFEGKDRPIFNRAVAGNYNPGSSIKPLLALAGLKENVITPSTTITDLSGYILVKNQYNPDIFYKYRDWKVQGTVNLKKALAQSSDIYFYSVGGGYGDIKGLGFEKLEKYFRTFLIDKILGVDVSGEAGGFVPSEEWKLEKLGQPWFIGDTYNVSIGQGDLLVTPLWLSSYVSAIANGGTFYKPFLVKKIIDREGGTIESFSRSEITKLPFDEATIKIVQEGMREVVLSGTGQLLNSLPVSAAAKTGTAEVGAKGGKLNSIFIAYAPYDHPEIAISVVVENIGKNQGLAIRTARDFLQWYFSK